MINRVVDFSVNNKFIVFALVACACVAGWWSLNHMALDAIPKQGNLANLRNLFQALENWTLAADLRSSAKVEVNAVYRTEQDARQINDALRGLLGLARLSTPSDSPELLRLYDGVQISMEKATVRMTADIATADLDSAMKKLPARKLA